jgi:hypothetical protein
MNKKERNRSVRLANLRRRRMQKATDATDEGTRVIDILRRIAVERRSA